MKPSPGVEGRTSGAAEIADALAARGACVIRMRPGPTQGLVDVFWAAHSAGRLLGTKVAVKVDGPKPGVDPLVTITVTPRQPVRQRRHALG
jgi:hypothetical protein